MKTLLLHHWERKLIAIGVAVVIWLLANHSMITTKTINSVPVRIINVPSGRTIQGLQNNGLMTKKMALTLVGNKTFLEDLSCHDLEVVVDAADKEDEWIVSIGKNNLVSLNPHLDLAKGISRLSHQSFPLRFTKLISEKIPILITQPIGEAPRGYHFLDIWPYQLNLTVNGPEEVVKRLKAKGLKLTFNLSDITKAELDGLHTSGTTLKGNEVSFFVPDEWKKISIPLLSETAVEIDDPDVKGLKIDFVHYDLLRIDHCVPIALFFPGENHTLLNPETVHIEPNGYVQNTQGVYHIHPPLYAKGVSSLFMEIVKDMLQIVVIAARSKEEESSLEWSVQFINPRLLEDRYVSAQLSDARDDEARDLQPRQREEHLRNRFRSYMNRFQLYKEQNTKLDLSIEKKGDQIFIKPLGEQW